MNRLSGLRAGVAALAVGLFALLAPVRASLGATLQGSPAPMTNQDVVKMVAAGLAEDVIMTAIRQAPRRAFDLTASGLIDLKLAHVPDAIVRAMQATDSEPAAVPPPAAPTPPPGRLPPASMPIAPPPPAT